MTITKPTVLEKWHKIMLSNDLQLLDEVLAEEVVFHSPVVHTPQKGKYITKLYLTAASEVLGGDGFTYVREIVGDGNFVLEFTKEIDGVHINGVDIVAFNEQGQIVDFKVMVRPLKAMQKVHQKMGEMLEKFKQKGNK